SSLGSGFKIAMRDLEIRGAGNILGRQQSGHITAVGFELYCQLLRESIARLKGQEVKPRVEVRTRLDFLAMTPSEAERSRERRVESREPAAESVNREACFLPHDYVADSRQRIELYRRIAQAASAEEVNTLRQELRDRFGPLPSAAELLLQLTALKLLAGELGVTAIETREDKIMLSRGDDYVQVGGKFPRFTGHTAAAKLADIGRVLAGLRQATRA
ncbi:MAG: transcription-repair coupling factor, partial [Verrucomicrobia bacterium]|nr:transcription-repair coupling factor [Verrucomicrobiota bacterium]